MIIGSLVANILGKRADLKWAEEKSLEQICQIIENSALKEREMFLTYSRLKIAQHNVII